MSYWTDKWENHTSRDSLKKSKEKKTLLILFLCLIIGILICLALLATKYRWFEKSKGLFFSEDSFKRVDAPGFPVIQYTNDEPSKSTVSSFPDAIPDYEGWDTVVLNNNKPNFTEYDINNTSGEYYSDLDSFGRCGTAIAMIDYTMMPTEPRGEIGDVRPSGWKQEKYPGIVNSEPPYLYNRCHLIAFMFTGQNANEKNLITGTRYFNTELMLPYENEVAQYLYDNDRPDSDGNYRHILYRVTPYFKGDELVARGVEIEAYSDEDEGKGISIHTFVYNVQPGIEIDYQTGENWKE